MSNFKKNQVHNKNSIYKSKKNQFKTKAVFSHSNTTKKRKNEATQTKKWRYGPKMVTHSVSQTDNEDSNTKRRKIQLITIKIKKALIDMSDRQFQQDFNSENGYSGFNGKDVVKNLFDALDELEENTLSTPFFEKKVKKKFL